MLSAKADTIALKHAELAGNYRQKTIRRGEERVVV
jgi:hypothetical protein